MKAGDKVSVDFTVVDAHDKDNVLLETSDGRRISLSSKLLAVRADEPEPEAPQA